MRSFLAFKAIFLFAFVGFYVLACAAFSNCTPSSRPTPDPSAPPAPPADASDASPYAPDADAVVACASLTHAGCPEGFDPRCAGRLTEAASLGHASAEQIACLRKAGTREEARRCAPQYVSCP